MPISTVTPESLHDAVSYLRQGQLVAFPTETVYGLGADARNVAAIQRLFKTKGRPNAHPVIVHIGHPDQLMGQLNQWACDIPDIAWTVCQTFWPGPLTVILRKHPDVSSLITGGQDTIGIRVPSHPDALALLNAFGHALVAPSANRFGRLSPTQATHVAEQFEPSEVPLVLDGGPCTVGIESTIVDFSDIDMSLTDYDDTDPLALPFNSRICRPGMIAAEQLRVVMNEAQALMPDLLSDPSPGSSPHAPRVSGTLESHYAPTKPVTLVPSFMLIDALNHYRADNLAVLSFQSQPDRVTHPAHWIVAPPHEIDYARHLYEWLHELDHSNASSIWVEWSHQQAWPGVADRLHRAASRMLSADMIASL